MEEEEVEERKRRCWNLVLKRSSVVKTKKRGVGGMKNRDGLKGLKYCSFNYFNK